MSNVGGIGGAGPAAPVGNAVPTSALTPESLLYYCASNLRSLDAEIATRMREQQGAAAANKALSALKSALAPYVAGGIGHDDLGAKETFLRKFKEAFDAAPPSARTAIQQQFDTFRRTACHNDRDPPHIGLANYGEQDLQNDLAAVKSPELASDGRTLKNGVGKEEVQWIVDALDNASKELSKDAELMMITLQSMISQRQMAVQLTTNMLDKINQTAMAVVNKVGG